MVYGALVSACRVYAGNGKWYGRRAIRMWTVPIGDFVARPSPLFYLKRHLFLTNEGSSVYPKWVALDEINDFDWHERRFTMEQCMAVAVGKDKYVIEQFDSLNSIR